RPLHGNQVRLHHDLTGGETSDRRNRGETPRRGSFVSAPYNFSEDPAPRLSRFQSGMEAAPRQWPRRGKFSRRATAAGLDRRLRRAVAYLGLGNQIGRTTMFQSNGLRAADDVMGFDGWAARVQELCGALDAVPTHGRPFSGGVARRQVNDLDIVEHYASVERLHWGARH